jgi:hypothetical protein
MEYNSKRHKSRGILSIFSVTDVEHNGRYPTFFLTRIRKKYQDTAPVEFFCYGSDVAVRVFLLQEEFQSGLDDDSAVMHKCYVDNNICRQYLYKSTGIELEPNVK